MALFLSLLSGSLLPYDYIVIFLRATAKRVHVSIPHNTQQSSCHTVGAEQMFMEWMLKIILLADNVAPGFRFCYSALKRH